MSNKESINEKGYTFMPSMFQETIRIMLQIHHFEDKQYYDELFWSFSTLKENDQIKIHLNSCKGGYPESAFLLMDYLNLKMIEGVKVSVYVHGQTASCGLLFTLWAINDPRINVLISNNSFFQYHDDTSNKNVNKDELRIVNNVAEEIMSPFFTRKELDKFTKINKKENEYYWDLNQFKEILKRSKMEHRVLRYF